MSLVYTILTVALGALLLANIAYLLLLLAAAVLLPARRSHTNTAAAPGVTVVIPAHNEEPVLGATLESLQAQDYPFQALRVVVVADNCTDRTAAIARQHGVEVLERFNTEQRGKGFALDWAFLQLLRDAPTDVYVVVDADTCVAPGFLTRLATHLGPLGGTELRAVQGRYGVLNHAEGWRAALMSAAFDLFNHLRPLGRERLGLSVGLKGNGMAFTRPLLERARWQGRSVTEDIDFGLDLLLQHGIRVEYAPEARVLAQMPVSAKQATSQRERWEGGRYQLLRERVPTLIGRGLVKRDPRLLEAGLDLLCLPLAELSGALLLLLGLTVLGSMLQLLPGGWSWLLLPLSILLGLGIYVVGGLRASKAPAASYVALLRAPFYACWKLGLYLTRFPRLSAAAAGSEWIRTPRTPMGGPEDPEQRPR